MKWTCTDFSPHRYSYCIAKIGLIGKMSKSGYGPV